MLCRNGRQSIQDQRPTTRPVENNKVFYEHDVNISPTKPMINHVTNAWHAYFVPS